MVADTKTAWWMQGGIGWEEKEKKGKVMVRRNHLHLVGKVRVVRDIEELIVKSESKHRLEQVMAVGVN